MQKRPVGRPKKVNAKRPGQLKKGECRYTFITTKETVELIKKGARKDNLKQREYLNKILQFYWNNNERLLNAYIMTLRKEPDF
jgi:hypothetical protein